MDRFGPDQGPVDSQGYAGSLGSALRFGAAVLKQKIGWLSDTQWKNIENCASAAGRPGRRGQTIVFVEAVLWIARTGSPWRDLPGVFGKWNSVFVRFNRWSEGGVWQRIFTALADDPDFEYLILDSTVVRAHQHAAGAKGGLKIRPSAVRAAA